MKNSTTWPAPFDRSQAEAALKALHHDEEGLATAEYGIVMLAAVGFSQPADGDPDLGHCSGPAQRRRRVRAEPLTTSMGRTRDTDGERGSVTAEFALSLLTIVAVLLLVLSLGAYGVQAVALESAAREAARQLARGSRLPRWRLLHGMLQEATSSCLSPQRVPTRRCPSAGRCASPVGWASTMLIRRRLLRGRSTSQVPAREQDPASCPGRARLRHGDGCRNHCGAHDPPGGDSPGQRRRRRGSQASRAADLAALVSADIARGLAAGDPCSAAAETVSRNAAEFVDCRVGGEFETEVRVTAAVEPTFVLLLKQA
ncbi:DUF4244 domain-containing protein [Nesterenkonia pannonica]|uniref:DUF4244 domain-containing protein n=1 Tax=Nesterenkonia pannonica TaxID=1548602 RepID=UPI002164D25C|nr:DUF4244 domain-containing protein [Nesterenkonia pannonica]